MDNVSIELPHQPGTLARMGEVLGENGIGIEGGGVFVHDGIGYANFLFKDGAAAQRALSEAGIRVTAVRKVLVQRLRQGTPGQLGAFTRRIANAGVTIEVQYSDHDNQLILVVDDYRKGKVVSDTWEREDSST